MSKADLAPLALGCAPCCRGGSFYGMLRNSGIWWKAMGEESEAALPGTAPEERDGANMSGQDAAH